MKKILNISLAAVLSVVPLVAHADIASKGYVDTEVAKKQNTLVSGTNIKTVGGTTLLGSGNIAFPTVDQAYSSTSENAASGKAVASAISNKADRATTLEGYGITDAASSAQGAKADSALQTVSQTGTGIVKSVSKNGTAVSVTAGALVASDIPNIAESQVTNLTTDLAAKQDVSKMVTADNINAYTTDDAKKAVYPSVYTAQKIADQSVTTYTNQVSGDIGNIKTDITALKAADTAIKGNIRVASDGNYIKADNGEGEGTVALNLGYLDTAVAAKANSADVYTKTQVDTELGKKVDKAQGTPNAKKIAGTKSDGTVVFVAPTTSGTGDFLTGVSVSDAGALTFSKGNVDLSSKQDASTAVKHTANTAVGGTAKPVFVAADGTATAISGTIGAAKTPVYISNGTITAGDALKNLAYKDSLVESDIPTLSASKINLGALEQVGSSLQGTTADGTYTLTAKIENGVASLKWELISR